MQAVKSVAMPMTSRRVDAGGLDRGRDRDAQHLAVVVRHLEGPLRRQCALAAGEVRGERPFEHGVRVGVDAGAELRAVGDADDDGAP